MDPDRVGDERVRGAPAGACRDGIRFAAVVAGPRATGEATPAATDAVADPVARLCARADLTALGLLLPPYLGNPGTQEDVTAPLTAPRPVRLDPALPDDESALVRQVIDEGTT